MRGTIRGKLETVLAVLFLIAKRQLDLPWWTLLFPLGVILLDLSISRYILYRRRRADEPEEKRAARTPLWKRAVGEKAQSGPPLSRQERMKMLWSRFRLFLALTSPVWIIALLGEGSLQFRLFGAVIMLVISGTVLFPLFLLSGFLIALGERWEEKKEGELEDAKKY